MRRILLPLLIFFLFATPAFADTDVETLDVNITINTILVFTINNAGPLTFTYDEYTDFGVANDIGDVDYDLTCNQGWQVQGLILDGTQSGQAAADWDDSGWTLSVNAVTIDESTPATVDSDTVACFRDDQVWEVLLNIPWSESVSTPDCTIQLTAADV